MKKFICIAVLSPILLFCLTACHFMQTTPKDIAKQVEATPMAEEMLTALAENRIPDAQALLHPQIKEPSETAFNQMSEYLDGRTIHAMELKDYSIQSSAGTSGKSRLERLVYWIELSDGTEIHVYTTYLSDLNGTGFTAFQLALGLA